MQLMSWPGRVRYSCFLQSFVIFSPLTSCIHSSLFSDWRHTVSSKFDTQVPAVSTEKLVLPRHARCAFSRLRGNGHCFLVRSHLSGIGRIENPSHSACGHPTQDTSHLILHCPAIDSLHCSLFGNSVRPLVEVVGSCPASGSLWSSAMLPSLEEVKTTTTRTPGLPTAKQTL